MEEEEIYLTSGEQLNEWLTNLRTMTPFVMAPIDLRNEAIPNPS